MVAGYSPPLNEIKDLLSRLRAETPEYPVELLEARKANFLNQAAMIKAKSKGPSGEGGHQAGGLRSGGSSKSNAGSNFVLGILLKAIKGLGAVVSFHLGASAFHNRVSG